MLVISDTLPIIGGIIAPPTIPIITNDDPNFVFVPNPLILKENMVGNMIDIKNATPIKANTENLA